ncbi:MAG: metallophosphoesterase [Alphaproteobacteria bacterium]|nr:metallophosphoesterase [Alphaproteobacteria bacterium]
MTTVAIIGDVHGNARALRAALAQARKGPFDRMVFLGDLLTYGHDVDEVLDLVAEAQEEDGAAVLVGNHDRMYFDLIEGRRDHFEGLPDWLKDSVSLTLEAPRTATLANALCWVDETQLDDGAIAAHANPYGRSDWRYLNSYGEHLDAGVALTRRSLDVGVFGHTHRPRFFDGVHAFGGPPFDEALEAGRGDPIIINAGAVGQPRDGTGQAVLLRLTLTKQTVRATFERVVYDLAAHIAALRGAKLPIATIERLLRFFG